MSYKNTGTENSNPNSVNKRIEVSNKNVYTKSKRKVNIVPILNISDRTFQSIFGDKSFDLPLRWDGKDFLHTLETLFSRYEAQIKSPGILPKDEEEKIHSICSILHKVIEIYYQGSPCGAYGMFKYAMSLLWEMPLLVENSEIEKPLFRLTRVENNALYDRKRIFHTPYTFRAKVSTNRYSIAGHPSLYLGTSLPLCWEELHPAPQDFTIAAAYHFQSTQAVIKILDLGIKPQDFIEGDIAESYERKRVVSFIASPLPSIRHNYLLWYPLIASCSFIRVNKKDPFAAEYIIPQLLMQWIKNQTLSKKSFYEAPNYNPPRTNADLIGIRYFSCASKRASDMGFDYVFPTSGSWIDKNTAYCPQLNSAFKLTMPAYLVDYPDTSACEAYLRSLPDSDYKDILS